MGAREVVQRALDLGQDDRLSVLERVWLYLVLTHAEDIAAQEYCVQLAEQKLGDMERGFLEVWRLIFQSHLEVVQKFGRFPHRNIFLMRPSTHEEEVFLNNPKYRFDLPVRLDVDSHTGNVRFTFIAQASNLGAVHSNVGSRKGSTCSTIFLTDMELPLRALPPDAVLLLRRAMVDPDPQRRVSSVSGATTINWSSSDTD